MDLGHKHTAELAIVQPVVLGQLLHRSVLDHKIVEQKPWERVMCRVVIMDTAKTQPGRRVMGIISLFRMTRRVVQLYLIRLANTVGRLFCRLHHLARGIRSVGGCCPMERPRGLWVVFRVLMTIYRHTVEPQQSPQHGQ